MKVNFQIVAIYVSIINGLQFRCFPKEIFPLQLLSINIERNFPFKYFERIILKY